MIFDPYKAKYIHPIKSNSILFVHWDLKLPNSNIQLENMFKYWTRERNLSQFLKISDFWKLHDLWPQVMWPHLHKNRKWSEQLKNIIFHLSNDVPHIILPSNVHEWQFDSFVWILEENHKIADVIGLRKLLIFFPKRNHASCI